MNQKTVKNLLSLADVEINGNNPWDLKILDKRFEDFSPVIRYGTLGLGESYMNGWWNVKKLDEFFFKVLSTDIEKHFSITPQLLWQVLITKLSNRQSKKRAFNIGKKHYDAGNDLYSRMLGKTMAYSCGYWANAETLDEAQEAKLDLICRKMGLKPGMYVLDIGCGWGSFLKFAAERYGVHAHGITVSKEQEEYIKEKKFPVLAFFDDYRNLSGIYDRIVSVGMFEHVGYKNYREFFEKVSSCLADDGLFLLHTIGSKTSSITGDPWTDRYIFPDGQLPSVAQIGKAIEGTFVMEDFHNFGADYDKTLMAWNENFQNNWKEIRPQYGDRFKKMWEYYLLSCAGSFRARRIQLWQLVLSKKGVLGGWKSVR